MARQFFMTSEALERRFLFAVATVNWNDVRQTVDGFGASTAWFSGTIPSTAVENIFNPNTGAGLTLLRSRVQPSGGSSEWQMMQQVAKYGVRVWSTPWTQPREWKTNHDTNNGGNLLSSHYQDYANHLADYVEDMTAKGIPMYAVSIQNEPNWQPDYESTIWSAQQFAAFLPYIGQTFAARGITTKIMLPESLNWNFSLASTIMADPNLAQYVGILAAHNYGETANSYQPVSIAGGKPVWMTEVSSSVTTSEIATAVDMADDIHQAMADANASAYHYWWLSTNSFAGGLTTGSWAATKRLWAMGNYSRFVRPGWVRVGTTDDGGLDVTTFKDPQSGKFAIVVVNTNSTNSVTEQFNLSGVTAGSVTPYITSATDNLVQYSPVTLTNGNTFSQTIAPNSVVTYFGVSATVPTLQAPNNFRVAPPFGATSNQLALSWSDNSTTETGYTVERSLDGNTWTVVTSTLPANTNMYTDTGLAENTKYFYRVKAQDGTSSSAYSPVVTYSTTLIAPTALTGTAVTGGIRLNWTVSSAASTGVSVYRSLDGVTWTNIATLTTRATTYTDTISGYDANQAYYYRIRNTAGTAFSTFTTWNSGLKAPTNFSSTRLTGRSVTLNWTNVAVSASGAWIEQQVGTSTTWTRISATSLEPSAGTLQVGGLTPGTTYRFRLRVSAAADSVYSAYTSTLTVNTPAANGLPIAWLKADETAGSTLLDSSNNYNDGTLTGNYSFITGKTGNAVRLSGGYASLPNGIVAGLNDFTVATWVNPTSATNWMRIFEFATSNTNTMFMTTRASDTSLPRFGITVNGSAQQRVDSSIAIPLNAWTHVAVTLSGNTATLYINGVVAGTNAAMTLRPAGLGQTSQNFLGKSINSWDPTLSASLDDFRVYDKALTSDEVRALTATTLPQPWVQADIGAPALPGSVSYNSTGGVWTVAGSGADIWNAADQFQFVSQSASGDFSIVARVNSLTNTDIWAKAGVMIRESAAANAAYALVAIRPDGQVMFQYRRTAGGAAENAALYGGTGGARYLKIERTAGMITGYYSADGVTWTATGPSVYVYMPRAVSAGLAVTSHNTAQIATASIDNVRLATAAVLSSVSINAGALQRSRLTGVSVTFSSPVTPAAGAFVVTRRSDGQSFAVTASNPSGDGLTFLLSFSGNGTESGSLPDGLYDLMVQGTLVRDALGQALAGGNYRYTLNRLFGDFNGDNFVNAVEQTQFNAFLNNAGAYNAIFDINADNRIDSIDAAAFNSRLGTSQPVAGLPSSMAWTSSGPLISAPFDATHTNAVSVKDPTVVFYNNKWYVFATWANTSGSWSLVYYSFSDWSQAATAKPLFLDTIPGMTGYKAAPTVFFMRPLNKWVLLFQGADPQYTLFDDIDHPELMSTPKSLFYKFPANSSGWIDFDLIADDRYIYLFFTKDNGEFWRSRTRLEDFPNGFDEPTLVMSRPTAPEMFEGSQTYKIAGTNKYLTIIEAYSNSGGRRYFTSYIADRLDGTWTSLGTSYTNPFAALTNVTFPAGTAAWSDNFSHGDLIRSTYDETMTIDPANLQLLYQGLDGSKVPAGTDYSQLPWQLGLLTLSNKNAPTNVAAVAASGTQVNITWTDRSTSEAGYLIERATDSQFATGLTRFTVAAGATAYADMSVLANTTYYYRVTTLTAGAAMDGTATAPAVTTPAVAPALAGYQIDDGTAQRSMIRKITLTFDQPVALDAADLVLRLNGTPISNVTFGLSAAGAFATQYVLTFAGTGTAAGSLKDGRYELVLNGVSITAASGVGLGSSPSILFSRLYGDVDGNRAVNFNDYLAFQNAFATTPASPAYLSGVDWDGNSVIDFNDFLAFQNNFGATV